MNSVSKNRQYYKFCLYGFLKNLRFFDAFFILFLIEKGLPFTQIGILYAIREIFINIFEIPSGIIADTYGRKNSLLGSLIAYIISFIIFYISGDFWLFAAAFIFYGIGDAFRTGTHKGMIMDYLKLNNWGDQKINYYGHTRSWSQKGSAISSLIAGAIVFYSGNYEHIFLYSIIPYLLNFLLILSYPKELNHSQQKQEEDRHDLGTTLRSFIKVIKRGRVLKIINTTAIHTAYLQAIKDYIQPLIVSIGVLLPILLDFDTEKKNGLIIGIIYFIIYMASSWASKFSSRVADKNRSNISTATLIIGFSLGIICGLLLLFNLTYIAIIAFVGIYLVENIRKPILTGQISDKVENDILTSVISAQSLLKTIMTALIAIIFGIIADHLGIGSAFIIVSGILISYSLLIDLFIRKRKLL